MPANFMPAPGFAPAVGSPVVGPQSSPLPPQAAGGGVGGAGAAGMDGLVRAMMLAKMRQGRNPVTPTAAEAFGPPGGAPSSAGGGGGFGMTPIS